MISQILSVMSGKTTWVGCRERESCGVRLRRKYHSSKFSIVNSINSLHKEPPLVPQYYCYKDKILFYFSFFHIYYSPSYLLADNLTSQC